MSEAGFTWLHSFGSVRRQNHTGRAPLLYLYLAYRFQSLDAVSGFFARVFLAAFVVLRVAPKWRR